MRVHVRIRGNKRAGGDEREHATMVRAKCFGLVLVGNKLGTFQQCEEREGLMYMSIKQCYALSVTLVAPMRGHKASNHI